MAEWRVSLAFLLHVGWADWVCRAVVKPEAVSYAIEEDGTRGRLVEAVMYMITHRWVRLLGLWSRRGSERASRL